MKSQLPLTMSLPIMIALATAIYGQAPDDAAILRASTETLLSMPEPPLGYAVTKHPLAAGEQLVGFQVQLMKEDAVSKVLIKVETRDLSDRGFRVAACKGYVNGFASGLRGAGYNITAHKLPDIENADFKTPVVVDLTFANDEGATILVNKRMFFTTKGYDVTVIATDENDLKMLTDWATQVQPAVRRP